MVLFGLILSSVSGNALSPLEASAWGVTDNNRRLANIYNLIAMVQLTIVLACCCQSMLMTNAVALESDISVVQFVVHTGDIKVALMNMTGHCAGLLLIQADIRIWMTTESPYRELSVAASFLITFWVRNIFFGKLGAAQPHCIVHILSNPLFFGARLALPGFGTGQAYIKKLAKRQGGALSQGAANNFGAHVLDSVREGYP